jgi:hypothetical protein
MASHLIRFQNRGGCRFEPFMFSVRTPNMALQNTIPRTTNAIMACITMVLAESDSGLILRGK